MSSIEGLLDIDIHRWYAVIYNADAEVICVLASTPDGLAKYDSMEEYEEAHG